MNAPTSPLPANLYRAEADAEGDLDIDTRIQRAEQRLILREENLHRRVNAVSRRVRRAVQPRRLLMPVAGGAMAVAGVWWLLRRRKPRPVPAGVAPLAAGGHGSGGHGAAASFAAAPPGSPFPWVRLLTLAWPLLPVSFRARVNPTTAGTVMAVGLPLAERLLVAARRPPPAPLATVAQVDLARFEGAWHQVACLPTLMERSCDGSATARYTVQRDGSLEVLHACHGRDGELRETLGVARPEPGSGGSRWRVSHWPHTLHWLPMAWTDCWVLHLDDRYSEALLGSPRRDALWLLSRRRQLPPQRLQALVQLARDLGFPVEQLKFVEPA